MALIIDGRKEAEQLLVKIAAEVALLKTQHAITPGLAIVCAGNDEASRIYVRNKRICAQKVGISAEVHDLSDVSTSNIVSLINDLNRRKDIHGIIVQLPLPANIEIDVVLNTVTPSKDVDGFTWENAGKLYYAEKSSSLLPCTPQGIMHLIKKARGQHLAGCKAVIIGRSRIVGKPTAAILLRENCTVTIAHSYSQNWQAESKMADILVVAAGTPGLITADAVKKGACVIDVGITRVNDIIHGDVNFAEVVQVAGCITPVPGGVGPMTVAYLMLNTLKAAFCLHAL